MRPHPHIESHNVGLPRTLCILLLLLLLYLPTTTASTQNPLKDNSPGCSCYTTSGPTAATFTYHRFHDFRALQRHVSIPPPVADNQDSGNEPSTDPFFDSTLWTSDWSVQNWAKNASSDAPVRLVNSPQNVYIGQDQPSTPTYLALRTTRLSTFQSTTEIESLQKNVLHASVRLRPRVYGNPGAVAGLFLYASDSCESDIEILTRDPASRIRYSNQPSVDGAGNVIAASEQDVALAPGVVWTGWNEHRVDWVAGRSAWFVNGVRVAGMEYGVPRWPSGLVVNLWGDGGVWSGGMAGGGEAGLEIQWVEMVFNTSGPVDGLVTGARRARRWWWWRGRGGEGREKRGVGGCRVPCTVDGVRRVGWPEYVRGGVVNEDRARGAVPLGLLGTLAVVAVGDVELAVAVLAVALAASFVGGV